MLIPPAFPKPDRLDCIEMCINNCDAFARLFGEVNPVFRRIGRTQEAVYIDLGTAGFDVIEITGQSVQVIKNPPVKFIRSRIQLPIGGISPNAKKTFYVSKSTYRSKPKMILPCSLPG
nr:hypothetical protein [uncultured Desulfobacter sp.]